MGSIIAQWRFHRKVHQHIHLLISQLIIRCKRLTNRQSLEVINTRLRRHFHFDTSQCTRG